MKGEFNEKELEYLEDKIIAVTRKELTWRTLEAYKVRLGSKIARLYRQLQEAEDEQRNLREKINALEVENKRLNSKEVTAIIKQQHDQEETAYQRALDLLRDSIGTEAYMQLMEKHAITWDAANGIKYKLTDKGRVYRRVGSSWEELCIIRPKSYPLPDSILAILVSVKDNPRRFGRRRR